MGKATALFLVGFLIFSPTLAMGAGTLHLVPEDAWGPALPDAELAGVRGGFNGLAFAVFFQGFSDTNQFTGSLTVDTTGAFGGPPTSLSVNGNQVNMQAVIGNLNGAQGVFQFTQVLGNFNVVNSIFNLQIVFLNVQNAAQIPSLAGVLGFPRQ